jgi:cation:H+ antiporter
MSTVWAIILLVGGLVILWKAADLLVSGAVSLAERLGVSPLVVGLTIVAMGTSAPEAAASIAAAVRGIGDVAVGNVYGSNVANLALVGGVSALIQPIRIQLLTLRREIPVMLAVTLFLWPVLGNSYLSRVESMVLLAVFAGLIALTVYSARKEGHKSISTQEHKGVSAQRSAVFVGIGLVGLAVGADMAVRGAVAIGERVGLSEAVIGLTIIAVGTSLPELATCVAASIKGHHDISVGTLVGSNIFNALLAIGAAGLVRPFAIVPRLAGGVDYWIMVIVSVGFAAAAVIGKRTIGRSSGTLLVCGYIGYIVYLLAYSG